VNAAQREAEQRKAAERESEARAEAERRQAVQRENEARVEAERREAERRQAERQDAERAAAAQREAERQKIAQREGEAERREAERQAADRRAAAQGDAQREQAARPPGAAQDSARAAANEAEEKREARLRAIGRQLDEERARREDLRADGRPPATLPLSLSNARRVRLWGRSHANAELVRYSEAWEQKIQMNIPVDMVRQVTKNVRTNPMVTVAVRRDGSVESIDFVTSSGAPDVDEAIRRLVKTLEHYQPFSPELARDYDVIEIRRTWHFDVGLRLY